VKGFVLGEFCLFFFFFVYVKAWSFVLVMFKCDVFL